MTAAEDKYPSPFYALSRGVYEGYAASRDGRVFNVVSGRELVGCKGNHGYISCSIRRNDGKIKNLLKHRIIYWCFNLDFDIHDQSRKVDHGDGVRSNNALDNLEEVTTSENNQRSHATDRSRRLRSAQTRTSVVQVIEDGSITEYLGLRAAVAACKINYDNFVKHLRSGLPHKERLFRLKFEDVQGELWYRIRDDYTLDEDAPKGIQGLHGLYVSDAGRISSPDGYVYQTRFNKQGDQPLQHRKVTKYFHQVLCFVFNGPPLNKNESVDHIDGDHKNNSPGNLRWLDKTGQMENQSRTFRILKKDTATGEITEYESTSSASRLTQLGRTTIRRACLSGKEMNGAIWTMKQREVGVALGRREGHPDFTVSVPYEQVRMMVNRGGEKFL